MNVRLFLDEDVHAGLCEALARRGFDAVHAQTLKRIGLADDAQLSYAIQQKRCLVSFNVKDFVLLHNRYVKAGKEHDGIIVSKQLPLRTVLAKLLALMSRHSHESLRNRLVFL